MVRDRWTAFSMSERQQCEGCAFNGDAAAEPYNRLRSEICALTGVPFYCHHGLDWTRPLALKNGLVVDMDGKSAKPVACAGWRDRMRANQLLPRGTSDMAILGRMVRKGKGKDALATLELAIKSEPKAKPGIWKKLHKMVRLLRHPFSPKEKITFDGPCDSDCDN
jgi:hypothetical protein